VLRRALALTYRQRERNLEDAPPLRHSPGAQYDVRYLMLALP
jgi:hypothetical protein